MRAIAQTCILTTALSGCFYGNYDSELHMAAGSLTQQYVARQTGSQLTGCIAAIGVGVAKEAVDGVVDGWVSDSRDILATASGCQFTVSW
ncbi:hypothetical protein [Aliiroseovarius sp.]|uniref:hypothetical protein n=1 Tax=Aliiroseovarius sp. TaxID=1872442 RepID=UPI002621456F|nr:hypothetical protein [Aliiroseovarius sp.]